MDQVFFPPNFPKLNSVIQVASSGIIYEGGLAFRTTDGECFFAQLYHDVLREIRMNPTHERFTCAVVKNGNCIYKPVSSLRRKVMSNIFIANIPRPRTIITIIDKLLKGKTFRTQNIVLARSDMGDGELNFFVHDTNMRKFVMVRDSTFLMEGREYEIEF